MKKREFFHYKDMIRYLKKIFKNGWEAFLRQGFLTFATSLVIFIAVVLATSLYFFQGGVSYLSDQLKDKIDISVAFKQEVDRDRILQIREDLTKLPEVKSVDYISPEDAYASFVEDHQGDEYVEALSLININPFLPSLRIQTKEPAQYKQISEYFQKDELKDLVNEVNDSKRGVMMERLSDINRSIQLIGITLTIFLSLIAIIVTFNTLRLSIYSQKEEIEIMRLVGAKNSFIRGPFLVQGFLCGLFAALFCFMIMVIVLFAFNAQLTLLFVGFDCVGFFKSNMANILSLGLLTGIGLGLLSSYFAVRKYLRD